MATGSRKRAIQTVREYQAMRPVFLDTETTGLDPHAEIIEIAVVDLDGNVLVDSLVKPTRSIPPDAIRIHGIQNELVADVLSWPAIWPSVAEALKGRYIGIYNADFDLRMIKQTHAQHTMAWDFQMGRVFDMMKLYSEFSEQSRWQSLDAAGRQCGIPLPNAHRARDDCFLLRALFQYIGGRAI
jgi:DNA polymerase III subunit epsilon